MVERLQYGFDNGLIDLSNEPGFLAPFLFSHCDRPDLTAKYVSTLRDNGFSIAKGYPDNEDSGAMGSWYIFTSLGLFPNAGQDFYYLLPPAFDDTELSMENGKKISIKVTDKSAGNKYIASVRLNGVPLNRSWVSHAEISGGALLEFTLTDDPRPGLQQSSPLRAEPNILSASTSPEPNSSIRRWMVWANSTLTIIIPLRKNLITGLQRI